LHDAWNVWVPSFSLVPLLVAIDFGTIAKKLVARQKKQKQRELEQRSPEFDVDAILMQ
jgi:hypothetical protein